MKIEMAIENALAFAKTSSDGACIRASHLHGSVRL
jgi:hypothetical protein